jgi:NPCBM/NEW2 domain
MKDEFRCRKGRNAKRRGSRLGVLLALYLFILPPSSFILCFGATVRTLDGKTYEGEVKLEQAGQISVDVEGGKSLKLKLAEVLQATFGAATPKTTRPRTDPKPFAAAPLILKEGLTLRSGTLLAGAHIEKAEDGTITFNKAGRHETVALVNVARIIFREIGPDLVAKIPEKRTGVLLFEGDFVEGEFRGLSRGRIQLSSVLFGLSSFDIRDKAVALVLGDVEPTRAQMLIRAQDGSSYIARSVTPDKDLLEIEDMLGAKYSINRWDVAELSAGQSRMESLADLKPVVVEPAGKDGPGGLTLNAAGLPMNLAGVLCDKGVTLTAGVSATWDLSGKYRAFTFKCGVPQGVLATAPVRFVVLVDGKELYKSRPRTSLDQPLAASVSLKDARSLTLKVESTAGEVIATPGLWGDVGLVK